MSNNEYMHSPMVSLLEKISIPCLADKKTGKFEDTSKLKLIDEEITKTLIELGIADDKEDVVVLRHVVLSHHGLLEYGSPVRPRIMEAEIIHIIDNLDANMMMMSTALSRIDKGEMTSRIFAMDNRSFYKPKL